MYIGLRWGVGMRITRKVFLDLAIYMVGFGTAVGLVFPYFVMYFNVPKSIAKSTEFVFACIVAGILVGFVNMIIVRLVIENRFKIMSDKMSSVEKKLRSTILSSNKSYFNIEDSKIPITSKDEIGRNAEIYNKLVETLSLTIYSEELSSDLSLTSIVEKGLEKLLHITHSSAGCILIQRASSLSVASNLGILQADTLENNDQVRQVLNTCKGRILKLPHSITASVVLTEFTPNEVMLEPIVSNNRAIGVILLASTKSYNDSTLKNRVAIVNVNLSRAINNAIAHDKVKRLAASDYLTEVYNKRFGMIRLQEELDISKRSKKPLCIVMFDLDHFKKVNDLYGHLAGDKVLIQVAKLAQAEIRNSDVLFRFGGEEFLIVLRNTTASDAYQLAERIRLKVESQPILYNEKKIHITSSFGVACTHNKELDDLNALLSTVDQALYQSKTLGRNRTTVAKSDKA